VLRLRFAARWPAAARNNYFSILTRHLFLCACDAPRNRTGLLSVVPRRAGLDCYLYDDDSGRFLRAVSCERLDAVFISLEFSGCFGSRNCPRIVNADLWRFAQHDKSYSARNHTAEGGCATRAWPLQASLDLPGRLVKTP